MAAQVHENVDVVIDPMTFTQPASILLRASFSSDLGYTVYPYSIDP